MPGAVSARTAPSPFAWVVAGFWLIMLAIICARVGVNPHKQSVYTADYQTAGWHWLHAQEVYSTHRHFLYSPLAAAAFVPLALLPLVLGNIVWRLLCAAAVAGVTAAWLRAGLSRLDAAQAQPASSLTASITFLLLLPLAVGNINLGQMNLVVLVLAAASVLAVRERHWNTAALLLAAAGYMKIYPLSIGLLLALLYPRKLAWRLALAALLLFGLSLIVQSPGYAWYEYRSWFAHLGVDDRLDVDLFASWRDFGFLLRACGLPVSDNAVRAIEVAAGGILALFLWVGQQRWQWSEDRLLGAVFFLGCSWMVLFGPATESATYVVLALPVCAAFGAVLAPPVSPVMRLWFGTAYGMLVFSEITNSWFHASTHHLAFRALQPVAALLFVAGVVWRLSVDPETSGSPALPSLSQ